MKVMKLRGRYLIFLVEPRLNYDKELVKKSIVESLTSLFGQNVLVSSGFKMVKYNSEKAAGIIKCNHLYVNHVRTAITLVNEINGLKVAIRVIKVTGTCKKARRILESLPYPEE